MTRDHEELFERMARSLHRRFDGIFNVETIERFLWDSMDRLVGGGAPRVTTFLPALAERLAGDRLRALAKTEDLVITDKPYVLFLCVHNAGRSQMAAGWLSHLAGDRVEVFSGGSDPASDVNPSAVQAMKEVGVDISSAAPRPWTDEVVRAADVVVTMGCGDACPVYPGKRYEDWEVPDPAGQGVESVRSIRDDIEQRVRQLMRELEVPATR